MKKNERLFVQNYRKSRRIFKLDASFVHFKSVLNLYDFHNLKNTLKLLNRIKASVLLSRLSSAPTYE